MARLVSPRLSRRAREARKDLCASSQRSVTARRGVPASMFHGRDKTDTATYGKLPAHLGAPSLHIFYDERCLDVKDALVKFVDLPKEFGGTGKLYEE